MHLNYPKFVFIIFGISHPNLLIFLRCTNLVFTDQIPVVGMHLDFLACFHKF